MTQTPIASDDSAAFVHVARVSDIPEDGVLGVEAPGGERICLIRCGARITAVRDECPHQAFPLSAGEVMGDGTIQCTWHGARFDCATGAVREGPATDPLVVFEVRVEGDAVLVSPRPR
jgi:3-phenylpropionate/trans-cinnamate dioxygenase ferredoxin subunit